MSSSLFNLLKDVAGVKEEDSLIKQILPFMPSVVGDVVHDALRAEEEVAFVRKHGYGSTRNHNMKDRGDVKDAHKREAVAILTPSKRK